MYIYKHVFENSYNHNVTQYNVRYQSCFSSQDLPSNFRFLNFKEELILLGIYSPSVFSVVNNITEFSQNLALI